VDSGGPREFRGGAAGRGCYCHSTRSLAAIIGFLHSCNAARGAAFV
jgi:hypothetical protein